MERGGPGGVVYAFPSSLGLGQNRTDELQVSKLCVEKSSGDQCDDQHLWLRVQEYNSFHPLEYAMMLHSFPRLGFSFGSAETVIIRTLSAISVTIIGIASRNSESPAH